MSSSRPFPDPEPVTCAYVETCSGGARFAVNVAIDPETDTSEVVACPACVETFLDGYGTTEAQVRELAPAERWTGGRDV